MKILKKAILNYIVIFVAGALIITSCDSSTPLDEQPVDTSSVNTSIESAYMAMDSINYEALLANLPIEDLSEVETADILFMREEEKLARDVYLVMFEQWNIITFKNISKSEQVHMDAILTLIERYGLEDPAAGNDIGEFENQELQQLYDDLIKAGSVSVLEALKVGALIEEVDIEDLENILSNDVDNQDIALVYGNLLRGSGYHLNAFVWNLGNQNVTYTPQVLTQENFDEIVD